MVVDRTSFEGVGVTSLAVVSGTAGPIGNVAMAAEAQTPAITQQGPVNAPVLGRA